MHTNEVGEISRYLSGRVGETLGLADWCQEINDQRLIRRRLTKRELAFILNRCLKNGQLQIEHRSGLAQYTFFKMDV